MLGKWERETLPKFFFFFLRNLKEKCQNEYYPDNLNAKSFCSFTSFQLLMFRIFLLKRNL